MSSLREVWSALGLQRGRVLRLTEGNVHVQLEPGQVLHCEILQTARNGPPVIDESDEVLVLSTPSGDGFILGRIVTPATRSTDTPDTLVVEAKHSLTLRVGDGSITIREDGKILIKGKDLVSHAQRMNRIKGGAVSIN